MAFIRDDHKTTNIITTYSIPVQLQMHNFKLPLPLICLTLTWQRAGSFACLSAVHSFFSSCHNSFLRMHEKYRLKNPMKSEKWHSVNNTLDSKTYWSKGKDKESLLESIRTSSSQVVSFWKGLTRKSTNKKTPPVPRMGRNSGPKTNVKQVYIWKSRKYQIYAKMWLCIFYSTHSFWTWIVVMLQPQSPKSWDPKT